jgi:proline iminopeptidase
VLYDQRGTGASTVTTLDATTISIAAYIRDLETIRHALGVAQWHVMGHSFGGILASQYVVEHPDMISRLILSSSAGFDLSLFESDHIGPIEAQLTPDELEQLHGLQARYRAGDHSEALLKAHAEVLARAYLVRDEHIPIIARRLYRADHEVGRLLTKDLKRMKFDASAALKRFKQPTLIIQGEQDVMDQGIAHRAHALLPASELCIIASVGHYGWLDQPETWLGTVQDFLRVDPSAEVP